MENGLVTDLRKNIVKRTLLNNFQFKTINQAKRNFNVTTAKEAYEWMAIIYNEVKEEEMKKLKEFKIKVPKKTQQPKKKFIKTFVVHIDLEIIYYHHTKDGKKVASKPYNTSVSTEIITGDISTVPQIVNNYNAEEYSSVKRVIDYKVEIMNDALKIKAKPREKQMMKNAVILRNDWLQFSKGISETAYTETDNKCVYYQLTRYLLTERDGRRPTKFIGQMRTSEEALFEFFQNEFSDEYSDFDMRKGVSTEMVSKLCRSIKRNMYAYDEDNKCFSSVIEFTSKNYAPIIFYKLHGHMYLIDDPKVIRSVAECNKSTAKKVITSSIDNENVEKVDISVFHLDQFPLNNIHQLEKGIYLLQKSNINTDVIDYVKKYKNDPMTKNRDNVIIQLTVKNYLDENVIIAVDINYSQNIAYEKLKNVAVTNSIKYVNEGIGSVICKILQGVDKRQYLTSDEKEIVLTRQNNKCCACLLSTEKYEIDHIKPLASGGSNNLDNLQALCTSCHKEKTAEENELGIYEVKDELESYFNDIAFDTVINTSHFKSYQFVEKLEDDEIIDSFKNDIIKCRRNISIHCKFDFPVYSVMDIPVQFSGIVQCGFFYVETNNIFPFRGCGWYCEPLVKYGLENNLIDVNNILLEFIPSKTQKNDYLQNNILKLLEAFSSEVDLQKLCINAYIGLMGRTKQTSSHSRFTLSEEEASSWWTEKCEEFKVFIKNHSLDNGVILYEGIFSKDVIAEGTKYPIYSMILQMEALELHKLENLIICNGGEILDRNTDAIRYKGANKMNIQNFYWDEEQTIKKYRTEEASPLKVEHLPKMKRAKIQTNFELIWNIDYDYNCSVEQKAVEIVNTNQSVHIDGQAGTGKTYLANKVIDEIKRQNKKYIAFSPTNKGARLIGGKTIHSVYYKYSHNKKSLFKILKEIDYIFIDEVSMMIEKFYQLFMMCKRAFTHLKFIIVGDFAQLAPVKDTWTGDYKNSPAMWSLCSGNRIQLTKCRRADQETFHMYNNVDKIVVEKFKPKIETYLNLAYTHKTRIKVNNECMERFIKTKKCLYHYIPMDVKNPKSQNVKLSVGMPVICHTTNKKLDILNSEKFKVSKIKDGLIIVIDDERSIQIPIIHFNKFLYLGFCITIHASQGETFDEPYTIYDWKFKCFCNRAKYVAISRTVSIQNIQIVG